MKNLLKISLLCTKAIPDERTTMIRVLSELLHIKEDRMEAMENYNILGVGRLSNEVKVEIDGYDR